MDKFFCKDRGCGISRWPGRVWAVVLFFGFASLGVLRASWGYTIFGAVKTIVASSPLMLMLIDGAAFGSSLPS